MKLLHGALALMVLATVPSAFARPIEPAERRYSPYSGQVPACGDPGVLKDIQKRFSEAEDEYWKSGLTILGFEQPGEIGFRSNGLDYIPRRYCTVRAMLNDQRVRIVSYSVGELLGMIGYDYGVEYCISGLDRNNAFAPNCKMARP
jgi:hypothetical protein